MEETSRHGASAMGVDSGWRDRLADGLGFKSPTRAGCVYDDCFEHWESLQEESDWDVVRSHYREVHWTHCHRLSAQEFKLWALVTATYAHDGGGERTYLKCTVEPEAVEAYLRGNHLPEVQVDRAVRHADHEGDRKQHRAGDPGDGGRLVLRSDEEGSQ